MKTIIFDLDGTLANIDHRRPYVTNGNHDWASFNHPMNIEQDKPNIPIVEIYKALQDTLEYRMVIFTGRTCSASKVTQSWLAQYDIFYEIMHMRLDGDFRPDHVVKQEMLDNLLDLGHTIFMVVDDRKQVLDMWQRNGIFTLDVGQGKGDF